MNEYISKHDVLVALMDNDLDHIQAPNGKEAVQILSDIPAADVVSVVRCRDCEAWQTDWNPAVPDRHYCAVMDSMMKADDFCSYGERKE